MNKFIITLVLFLITIFTNNIHAQEFDWAKDLRSAEGLNRITATATDGQHNIFVVGIIAPKVGFGPFDDDTDFDVSDAGTAYEGSVSLGDIFITKYDSESNLLWVKTLPGTATPQGLPKPSYDNYVNDIVIDANDNIYITGLFKNQVDFNPDENDTHLLTVNSSLLTTPDAFLLKLNNDGEFQWVNQYGGETVCFGTKVIIDNENNLYLAGGFNGAVDFSSSSTPVVLTSSDIDLSARDIFYLKLDTDGDLIWANKFGGEYNDQILDMSVDINQNVILTGYFINSVNYTIGGVDTTLTGLENETSAFLLKTNNVGEGLWIKTPTHLTPSNANGLWSVGHAAITDELGNIYYVLHFDGTVDFDYSDGVNAITSFASTPVIAKLTPDGELEWTTRVDGEIFENTAIVMGTNNDLYLLGIYRLNGTFPSNVADIEVTSNITEGFTVNTYLANMNSSTGNFEWVNTIKANLSATDVPGRVVGRSISYANGVMLIAGSWGQTANFDITNNSEVFLTSDADYFESFIVKLKDVTLNNHLVETNNISLYPNPVIDNVNVDFTTQQANVKVEIIDVTGKKMISKAFKNTSSISLSTSNLNAGIYFVELLSENKKYVIKFIKQ